MITVKWYAFKTTFTFEVTEQDYKEFIESFTVEGIRTQGSKCSFCRTYQTSTDCGACPVHFRHVHGYQRVYYYCGDLIPEKVKQAKRVVRARVNGKYIQAPKSVQTLKNFRARILCARVD